MSTLAAQGRLTDSNRLSSSSVEEQAHWKVEQVQLVTLRRNDGGCVGACC